MYKLCVLISGETFTTGKITSAGTVLAHGKKLSTQSKVTITVLKNGKPIAVIRRGKIIAIVNKDEMASAIMKARKITNELLLEVLNFYI